MLGKIRTNLKKPRRLIIFLLAAVISAVLLIKFVDLTLGILNSSGLSETIFPPNARVHHKSLEFETTDQISSQGLRNEEIALPKPANTIRILAVGDSLTYGWGVDLPDSWPKQLEKRLQSKFPGKKVEVINAGAPGTEPPDYVNICQIYTKATASDYVIWGLSYEDFNYLGILHSNPSQEVLANYWYKRLLPNISGLATKRIFDFQYSGAQFETQAYLRNQVDWIIQKVGLPALLKIDPTVREAVLQGLINPSLVYLAIVEPNLYELGLDRSSLSEALDQLKVELDRGLDSCQQGGAKFLGAVYIPTSTYISQVYQDAQAKLGFPEEPRLLSSNLVEEELPKIFPPGLKVWVPTKSLRDSCGDCFYPLDSHMKKDGYAILVQTIVDDLSLDQLK